jgi:hypothetical protein
MDQSFELSAFTPGRSSVVALAVGVCPGAIVTIDAQD